MTQKKQAAARPEHAFAAGRLELKKAGAPTTDGTFSGYGATYEPHPTSAWMLPPDWQDVFKPGAFARTLAEHKARGSRPSMLFMHDLDDVMGVWDEIAEDKNGLAMSGRLCIEVQEIADRYALMKMGAIQSLSVGFVPVVVELDEKSKTRTIVDADLFETSIVSVPGNPGALISDVKAKGGMGAKMTQAMMDGLEEIKAHAQSMMEGCDKCDHEATIEMAEDLKDQLGDTEGEDKGRRVDPYNVRDMEAVLREAGLSRSEAKAFIAGGFKAVHPRDADGLAETFAKLKKTLKGE